MSHATVLVIGADIESALAPFWELDLPKEEIQKDPRAVFEVKIGEGLLDASFFGWKDKNPKYQKEYNYPNAQKWLEDWHGYGKGPGGWGYWSNPNAKWDWYSVGGRWSDFFVSRNGEKSDSLKKGSIDWEFMKAARAKEAEKNWNEYLIGKVEGDKFASFRYGIRNGDTRESYIERNSKIGTFAVLKDGIWHERGEMGWWGMVHGEKDADQWQATWKKLIDEAGDDEVFTLVDYHI